MSRRSRDVYLFRMCLEHDQTHGTSVLYDFSNSRAKRSAGVCSLFKWPFSYWQQSKYTSRLRIGILCKNVRVYLVSYKTSNPLLLSVKFLNLLTDYKSELIQIIQKQNVHSNVLMIVFYS